MMRFRDSEEKFIFRINRSKSNRHMFDQKARNLAKNPNCIVGTQNAAEAVILEGVAELVTDPAIGKKLEPTSRSKYGMSGGDGSEPLYRVRPIRVFGLIEKSFPKTATRWIFD